MDKNKILIVGSGFLLAAAKVALSKSKKEVVVINSAFENEPMKITNPYSEIPPVQIIKSVGKSKKQSNRKKHKRKKARNGKH